MKILTYLRNQKTYDFVFGLLCFFSVLGSSIANVMLVISIIMFSVSFSSSQKKELAQLIRLPYFLLIVFVLYIYLGGLFLGVLDEKRFQLLYLIPLLLLLGTKVKSVFKIGFGFVLGNLVLMIFGMINIIRDYTINPNFTLKEGATVNKLLLLERPYLGFVCVLGVLISFYLFKNALKFKNYYIVVAILLSAYIVLISARLALISLCLILFTYLICYLKTAIKYKLIVFVFLFFSFSSAFYLNPTLADRFLLFSNIDFKSEEIKDYEPRVIIWQCAFNIYENPNYDRFFGMVSTQKLSDELVACYQKDKGNDIRRGFFVQTKFNTHNQYLDLLLTTGYFGVGLLILLFLTMLIMYYKNFYVVALTLAIGMFLFTENGFSRQTGVYLVGFGFVFIYLFQRLRSVNS